MIKISLSIQKTFILFLFIFCFITIPNNLKVYASENNTDYKQNNQVYTLIEIQEGGEKPNGNNIITTYIYNEITGAKTPVYYMLTLNNTTYGTGDSSRYYAWEDKPNYALNNFINVEASQAQIKVNYDSQDLSTDRIDTTIGNWVANSNIERNFIDKTSSEKGGAIYNQNNSIGNITGNFIGNSTYNETKKTYGGAIYNEGEIKNITGNFIGNNSYSVNSNVNGGAIFNNNIIEEINGNFIGNSIKTDKTYGFGGAIYLETGTIGSIKGNFIGNYIDGYTGSNGALGSAIINLSGKIGYIEGNFIGNQTYSKVNGYSGGTIYNEGDIDYINANFILNKTLTDGSVSDAGGSGLIHALGTIKELNANFISNTVISKNDNAQATIYLNGGKIINLNGTFKDNLVQADHQSMGSAIFNLYGTIENLNADFYNNKSITINNNEYSDCYSDGTIFNIYGTINNINGKFINNSAESPKGMSFGGAIENTNSSYIGTITGIFIDNHISSNLTAYGGAIENTTSTIDYINADFIGNHVISNADAIGGAIDNYGTIGEITGNFINNYTKSYNSKALGGAISSYNDLKISADNKKIVFSGNYTDSAGVIDDNAIYMHSSNTDLNFILKNGGSILMQDNIDGDSVKDATTGIIDSYNVNITGDNKDLTTFYLLNDIRKADLRVNNVTLNTINQKIHVYDFNSFTLNGDTNFVADVDLINQSMDRITANIYGKHNGNLNVIGMNLINDIPSNRNYTEIYFAQPGLKDSVINNVNENSIKYQTELQTPIYRYNVFYDNRDDAGYFIFAKGNTKLNYNSDGSISISSSGNPSEAFNPSVLSTPVASQAGAYATQIATFNYAFQHADSFMPLPFNERFSLINSNKYAITDYKELLYNDNEFHNKSIWVKPYTSFENIPLKNGPKVDTITYGTLIGGDSDFYRLKHGWGTVSSAYIGYNGSSQSYSGINTYQNGGIIGLTQTFYKNNFFTAITASVGASAGESQNMYGNEYFTMLMAGIASKSGYNLEFQEGKFIIQPTMLLSYSFINTFDYKNSAGVKINSDPLHAIQINPNIRLIANMKNGWQPYLSVGMIWNLLNVTKVKANDVRLPEMSIKPYVQYGVGVQKRWKDKFTGFIQAMIRNGGRNGIALTAGFRWTIGKDNIELTNNNKTIIKCLKNMK